MSTAAAIGYVHRLPDVVPAGRVARTSKQALRDRLYEAVGAQHKALGCWKTPAYMRLARAGACQICRAALATLDAAWTHARTSRTCVAALAAGPEQAAWQAQQAWLRERLTRDPLLFSTRVSEWSCFRCGTRFVTQRRRRPAYCGSPLCERVAARERRLRWQTRQPVAVLRRLACAQCHHTFAARRRDARLCGPACRQRARRHGSREPHFEMTFQTPVTAVPVAVGVATV